MFYIKRLITYLFKGIIIFVLLYPVVGKAKDTVYVGVRAQVQQDAILLRWAPGNSILWKQTNKYGFNVERYTMVRDGKTLPEPELKKLTASPLKAKPLDEWEQIAQNDDYAAIIAQALYGEEFELAPGSQQSNIMTIVNKSQELEQRFSVSLYAADNSFEAALMAAWGWRDTEIKQNERYLYRIIPAVPENSGVHIEYGSVFVAADELEALPKPVDLTGIFGDKSVMLSWDYFSLSYIYHSYYIEKSTDGKNYIRQNGIPVTNMNNNEGQALQRIYFLDSLENNTDRYYYRIAGRTIFGETGPPSDSIMGQGRGISIYIPNINYTNINETGNLELGWEFDERGNALIKNFELRHSPDADKYETLIANISPDTRLLTIAGDKLSLSNYFIITAIPNEGEPSSSFPVLVQPVDSVPPAVPAGLTGTVDSSGTVILQWNKNTEKDLRGYKVFRSQLKNEEPVPLFDIAIKDTTYRDSIQIDNLNREVYYAVASMDLRYNQSDLSEQLELVKPDIAPPSPPVISGYMIRDEGIEINWINSSCDGVTGHRIRRKNGNEVSSQILLATINNAEQTSYIDTSAVTGIRYIYTVTAVKNSKLESNPSNEMTLVTVKSKYENMGIERFDAIVDKQNKMLKLLWNDKLKDVLYYEIYRGTNERKASLWRTLKNGEHETIDNKLQIDTEYLYIIRAILKSGKNTASKSLRIKY
jgi:fibronectin type 3 domain-containing protein